MKLKAIASTNLCSIVFLAGCVFLTGCRSNDSKQLLSQEQKVVLPLTYDPQTFDPRKATGLETANLMHMLFEGLTKVDSTGKVLAGAAEQIEVSPDMKTYTFVLKESKWSNGESVLASDFAYSWRTQLENELAHSYLLTVIKGAHQKDTKLGISVIDNRTLKVELKKPTPYFLQLVATQAFFPVHEGWTEDHPDYMQDGKAACVGNGPFALASYTDGEKVVLNKNTQYWNSALVTLNEVHFTPVTDMQEYSAFNQKQLDWIGNPFSVLSNIAMKELTAATTLESKPSFATAYLQINVEAKGFKNQNMRKALSFCINREKAIQSAMDSDEIVAMNFVPDAFGLPSDQDNAQNSRYDTEAAKTAYKQALSEESIEEMTPIELVYMQSARTDMIAETIQKAIQETFSTDVKLLGLDPEAFLERLETRRYTLAINSWIAEYYDPMSYLSLFSSATNGINTTGWSSETYKGLLRESSMQMDQKRRFALLGKAQNILMKEAPIVPLFHFTFSYAKSKSLEGALLSPLGLVELNTAFKNNKAN